MASKVVTCTVQLDADATRTAETVAAMLEAQGRESDIDEIVSNAVRIAYGQRVVDLVKDAGNPAREHLAVMKAAAQAG